MRRLAAARFRCHPSGVTTSVSSKGQIEIPAELRIRDGIKTGQKFTVERLDAGEYRLVRLRHKKTKGLVDWLLSCPVKGTIKPLKSESTRTL